jgi:predicted acylesterase/phospholipase RssA
VALTVEAGWARGHAHIGALQVLIEPGRVTTEAALDEAGLATA